MTNETQLTEQLACFKHLCLVEQASESVVSAQVAKITRLCERMRTEGWTEESLDQIAKRELYGFGMPR